MYKMRNEPQYISICREDPLRCIFLSEFHPIAGPKITCQVPENYISKEIFDAVSVYIIPKAHLQRSTITITLCESKILGFPIRIDNKKYARNAFYFNLCFVCDASARCVQYEPVVKKLADFLMTMELECHFLSKKQIMPGIPHHLSQMLQQVLHDLNIHRMCTLTVGTTTTHLKVVRMSKDPEPVQDHEVPVFIEDETEFLKEQWDLTTYQILPYIDGVNHVARIAAEADVENNLVKSCVQNLVYYGVVTMIPIFQYSNVYAVTPKLRLLVENKDLQERCIKYVSKLVRQPATLRDIFKMYSCMTYGTTIRDLCVRFNPHPLKINERKLVQFGILEGLIRRVYKYPVYIPDTNHNNSNNPNNHYDNVNQHQNFNGQLSTDEICCAQGLSSHQLEEELEKDPNIVIIWK